MSQDVLLTVMNSMSLIDGSVNVERKQNESCDKCFKLEAELLKSQNAHNDLLKRCSQLEKHCISLESSIKLNKETFQKDESCDNQNAVEILEFFEKNDLKAQVQDKDTTISSEAGTDNRPPMLEESDFEFWKIRIKSKDISIVSYVDLYTHLKRYEQHAMKTLSKVNQTSGNADPLAYMAQATQSSSYTPSQQYPQPITSLLSQYVPPPPQYTPAPQQAP
nr:hypothetical protein [Tanacetum cinerariifolium]